MIARYMAANPRVTVELESTRRRVDVIGEGIDVALRVRFPPLEPTDLVMRTLGASPQRLVASPESGIGDRCHWCRPISAHCRASTSAPTATASISGNSTAPTAHRARRAQAAPRD